MTESTMLTQIYTAAFLIGEKLSENRTSANMAFPSSPENERRCAATFFLALFSPAAAPEEERRPNSPWRTREDSGDARCILM